MMGAGLISKGMTMDPRVADVLKEAFPDETDMMGDELIDELVVADDEQEHLSLEGGDNFDLAPVYEFLKSVSIVVKKMISDRDKRKRDQVTTNVTIKAKDIEVILTGADAAFKEEIAKHIPRIFDIIEKQAGQAA